MCWCSLLVFLVCVSIVHVASFSVSKETLFRLLMGLCLDMWVCVCSEAEFVGSVLLRESVNSSIGDDDKIYFFFTERSQEQIAYPSQTKVSRIARVCKVRNQKVRVTIITLTV